MTWVVDVQLVADWLLSLDKKSYAQVQSAIEVLEDEDPHLGRPLVDTISQSRYPNMKELRPGSSQTSEIRILFAFDPQRKAIMLIAGDKQGKWSRWYRRFIPLADQLYANHLRHLGKETP